MSVFGIGGQALRRMILMRAFFCLGAPSAELSDVDNWLGWALDFRGLQASSSLSSGGKFAIALRRSASHRWPVRRGLIVGAAFVWGGFWLALAYVRPGIYEEHGLMENFQAITLVMGVLLSGSMAGTKRLGVPVRILMAGVGLFFFMFFLLEFDTRALNMPTLERWTNGMLRNLWVGALVAAYGVLLLRHFKPVWAVFLNWLEAVPGLLMVISGFFWVAGFIVDKFLHFADKGTGLFLEELFECEATLFMGLAVLLTRTFWRGEK